MIFGIGTDIVKVKRIEKLMEKEGFLDRIFTGREVEYFKKHNMKSESVAAGFAAKEAVSKAMGTGISGFNFSDIEILHEENGKPNVNLLGKAKELSGDRKIHISISHERENAIAFCVIED
ncbi:MAG: holo-ACP synthase [Clostridia bacterium]|nr:holo-ACP synthase [Clostridia bacterium]